MGTSRLKVVCRPVLLIVWLLIFSTTISAVNLKEKGALDKPAYSLAEQSENKDIAKAAIPIQQKTPNQIEDFGRPWWYWAISVVVLAAVSYSLSAARSSGNGGSSSSCPTGEGTCGSTIITW